MESNDTSDIRERIKEIIQSNMFIQFKDHASLLDMDIHEAVIKVADYKINAVIDQILEAVDKKTCKCTDCKCN